MNPTTHPQAPDDSSSHWTPTHLPHQAPQPRGRPLRASTPTPTERLRRAIEYDPTLAHARLGATASSTDGLRVMVRSRHHLTVVDEPAPLGGRDDGPNPVELLLGALASCQVITYRLWADHLGVALNAVDVEATATIDLSGLVDAGPADPGALTGVELRVTLSGPAEPEAYAALRRTVDDRSPLLAALTTTTPVRTMLRLG